MDKIETYRQIVQEILLYHSQIKPIFGEVESGVVFDVERDLYQVIRTGWMNKRRVYGALIHIDIKDGKIWIEYDGTEVGVANELTERGIPKDCIVLADHAPSMRPYNGFAVS
ncbi:MAG: XisI protein [Roseofilum sp. SBFL]|uniref:XisI protein n=1 Tax=unclassified Roseofilum TaxID=2620099 RepID=UPI001B283C22|nr:MULTISPECIES: XisI protein [unclassified Roseofilum]MBP0015713.1 XisI protein [Roseofilum sp. SID3]MBP0024248.1 XisI protein [Roseofilum sp. SID2]MBP0037888.1 XisI protein [Roseofilum sp. SID1]MBP0043105.1 XisI protein [Roseofilum sp. SBFL]